MNIRSLMLMLLCALPAIASADLSGSWRSNGGGTYYLRQVGDTLYWYGENSAKNPVWSNVFSGKVRGSSVSGQWLDVPKGRTRNQGSLTLKVTADGNTLEATSKTGGFGDSKWTRQTGLERHINRGGQDYKSFPMDKADPKLCQQACFKETRCVAWTYVNPGLQGPKSKCWLKHKVPAPKFDKCCVSGVVNRRVIDKFKLPVPGFVAPGFLAPARP